MNAHDHFETALLDELTTYAEERRRTTTMRRRIVLVGAAAAAAAGLVLAPGFGAQNTPAYSVQEGNDGEVIVTVRDLDDAAALERAIEARGIKVDVTFLRPGTRCASGRYQVVNRALTGLLMRVGTDEFTVTIPPGTVRDDETFVLSAAHQTFPDTVDAAGNELTDRVSFAVEAELAAGSVEPCRVEQGDPLPEPPR